MYVVGSSAAKVAYQSGYLKAHRSLFDRGQPLTQQITGKTSHSWEAKVKTCLETSYIGYRKDVSIVEMDNRS